MFVFIKIFISKQMENETDSQRQGEKVLYRRDPFRKPNVGYCYRGGWTCFLKKNWPENLFRPRLRFLF